MLNPTTRPTMLRQSEIDLETLHDQTPDTTTFGASYPAHIATQLLRPFFRTASPDIMPEHEESLGGKTCLVAAGSDNFIERTVNTVLKLAKKTYDKANIIVERDLNDITIQVLQ